MVQDDLRRAVSAAGGTMTDDASLPPITAPPAPKRIATPTTSVAPTNEDAYAPRFEDTEARRRAATAEEYQTQLATNAEENRKTQLRSLTHAQPLSEVDPTTGQERPKLDEQGRVAFGPPPITPNPAIAKTVEDDAYRARAVTIPKPANGLLESPKQVAAANRMQGDEAKRAAGVLRGLKAQGVEMVTDLQGNVSPKKDEQGRLVYKPEVLSHFEDRGNGSYVSVHRDRLGNEQDIPLQPKIDKTTGEKYVVSADGVSRLSLGVDSDYVLRKDASDAGQIASQARGELTAITQQQSELKKQIEDYGGKAAMIAANKNATDADRAQLKQIQTDRATAVKQLDQLKEVHAARSEEAQAATATYLEKRGVIIDRLKKKDGPTPTYDTKLPPEEESAFQYWKKQNVPNDSGNDYDFRGAFKAGVTADANGHWPDTFKKPNHPTFSEDSQYAPLRPDLAGRWEGDKFIPPGATMPTNVAAAKALAGDTKADAQLTTDPQYRAFKSQLLDRVRSKEISPEEAAKQNEDHLREMAGPELATYHMALSDAKAGRKPYTIDEKTGNFQFDPHKPADSLEAAVKDGIVDRKYADQHRAEFQQVQSKYEEVVKAAGGSQEAKALLHGAGVGAAFLAGAAPSGRYGASLLAETGPVGATIGGVAGSLIGGTITSAAARAAMKKLGDYSDAVKSLNASAELHPVLDATGELVAFGASAPRALTKLYQLGRIAAVEGGTSAALKTVGKQIAIGGATGAAFEAVARPAFDKGRYLIADQLGISHDKFQGPTAQSLATNIGLGILTAGHGIEFKNYSEADVASILLRGKVRAQAGVKPTDEMSVPDVVATMQKMGVDVDAQNAQALAKPLSTTEAALHQHLSRKVAAMEARGDFEGATGARFGEAQQAVVPTAGGKRDASLATSVVEATRGGGEPGKGPGEKPPTPLTDAEINATLDGLRGDAKTHVADLQGERQMIQTEIDDPATPATDKARHIERLDAIDREISAVQALHPQQTTPGVTTNAGSQKQPAQRSDTQVPAAASGGESNNRPVPDESAAQVQDARRPATAEKPQSRQGDVAKTERQPSGETGGSELLRSESKEERALGQAARLAKVEYGGSEGELHHFNDPKSGTSFAVPHGTTPHDFIAKLAQARERMGETPANTAKVTEFLRDKDPTKSAKEGGVSDSAAVSMAQQLAGKKFVGGVSEARQILAEHKEKFISSASSEAGKMNAQSEKSNALDNSGTVDAAAHEAATSPQNGKQTPSMAQHEADNAKLGHSSISGMPISFENPAGSIRTNVDMARVRSLAGLANEKGEDSSVAAARQLVAAHKAGNAEAVKGLATMLKRKHPEIAKGDHPWASKMLAHYGRFKGTVGKDGDHLDAYVKQGTPTNWTGTVYVVNQKKQDGSFDETKSMVGYASQAEAVAEYAKHYDIPAAKLIDSVAAMPWEQFKQWAREGDHTKKATNANNLEKTTAVSIREASKASEGKGAGGTAVSRPAGVSERPAGRPVSDATQAAPGPTPTVAGPTALRGTQNWHHELQTAFRKFKTRLTRAKNANDLHAIVAVAKDFNDYFEAAGTFPDQWADFARAGEDAASALIRGEKSGVEIPQTPIGGGTAGRANRLLTEAMVRGKAKATLKALDVEIVKGERSMEMQAHQQAGTNIVHYRLALNPDRIDERTAHMSDDEAREYVTKGISEELIHGAQYEAARRTWDGKGKFDDHFQKEYEAVEAAMTDEERDAVWGAYGSDIQGGRLGAEFVRQLIQTGREGTPTEATIRAKSIIERILAVLKRLLDNAASWSEALKRAYDRTSAVLDSIEKATETKADATPATEPKPQQAPAAPAERQVEAPAAAREPRAPATGAVSASGASDTLKAQGKRAFEGLFAPDPSLAQIPLPKERRAAFFDLADKMEAEGILTPEKVAAFLDEISGGKARWYSQALWDTMGASGAVARGEHNWDAIYSALAQTPNEAHVAASDERDTRPSDQHAGVTAGTEADRAGENGPSGQVPGSAVPPAELAGERSDAGPATGQPGSSGQGAGAGSVTEPGRRDVGATDAGNAPGDNLTVAGSRSDVGTGGDEPSRPGAYRNHIIQPGDVIAPKGTVAKLRANIGAVKLLKKLESDNRDATPEEKQKLAQYTGWGQFKGAFDTIRADRRGTYNEDRAWNERWGATYDQLKKLLTPEEWNTAAESTLNAHFTAPEEIRAMWDIAKRLGFEGGKVLEPAVGVGHFFGLMPPEIAAKSKLFGLDMDRLSSGIARKLYPQADIKTGRLEKAKLPNNYFDLVISNVPFHEVGPGDNRYPSLNLHNYFFARSFDLVKPGGLVVAISSNSTLDNNPDQRAYLQSKADLVAAIRLPNDAFLENAGTEVTTDILIFRKPDGTPFKGESFLNTVQLGSEGEKPIVANEYFQRHPEMALGMHSLKGTQYKADSYALTADKYRPIDKALPEAIATLPENLLNHSADFYAQNSQDFGIAKEGEKEGSISFRDGQPLQITGSEYRQPPWATSNFRSRMRDPRARVAAAKSFVGIRDKLKELLTAELQEGFDESGPLRGELVLAAPEPGSPDEAKRSALISAYAELPATERKVVGLKVAGVSDAEISRQLKLSPVGVETAYNIALKKLNRARVTGETVRDKFREVAAEKPGERTMGRPELANPAQGPMSRRLVDTVDELRKEAGIPGVVKDVDVAKEAKQRLEKDYAGERRSLMKRAAQGGMFDDVETLMAKRIVAREALGAVKSNSKKKMLDAAKLIDSYRMTGSTQARAFRQRQDFTMLPEERAAEYLSQALLTPDGPRRKRLEILEEPSKREEVLREWMEQVEQLKKRLAKLGLDLDSMTDEQLQTALKDRVKAVRAVRAVNEAKADNWDALYEYWISAILSAPPTQVANIVGNASNAAWDFTAQRLTEAIVNLAVRDPASAQFGEFKHIIRGAMPGFQRAGRNFLMAWRTEAPIFEEEVTGEEGHAKIETQVGHKSAITGTKGRVIRTPLRLLLAADEFSKSLVGQMQVGAEAYRIAKGEKLTGDALGARISDLTGTLGSEAWKAAALKATELAFQQELGRMGKAVINFRENTPVTRYVIPFIQTMSNIFKVGIRKTPLGSISLLYNVGRQGMVRLGFDKGEWRYSRKEFVPHLAEQLLAWAIYLAIQGLTEPDHEKDDLPAWTGTVPYQGTKRGERDLAYRTAPPMSFRIGSEWYSYARIEPAATALAAMIDFQNELRKAKDGKDYTAALGSMFTHLIAQVKDKTFARGIGDILNAIEDGQHFTEWAGNFATSWVPNLVKVGARESDPYIREQKAWGRGEDWTANFMDALRYKGLPLSSEVIQPKIDLWGRPVEKDKGISPATDWLFRMISPVRTQPTTKVLEVDRLITNWNNSHPNEVFAPQPPAPYWSKKIDGKEQTFQMNREEYRQYLEMSGAEALGRIEVQGMNPDSPTQKDLDAISDALKKSHKDVKERLWEQRLARKAAA